MKADESSIVLGKVNDLNGYLESTRRSIPFMEDILAFVRDIVPVIEELKKSVELSSDKLPTASKQLDKVTSATEMASTEILNIVEGILARIETMGSPIPDAEAARAVDECIQALSAATAAPLRRAWEAYRAQHELRATELQKDLAIIQNDCTSIMIALQVQDITAQQIAAVNRLMASVDEGFSRLMKDLDGEAGRHDPERFKHRALDIVFDANADYPGGEARQKLADSVVEQTRRQEAHEKG